MSIASQLFSAEQAHQIDQYLIHDKKISSLLLMAKAAYACFNELLKQAPTKITVVTAQGNNSGDGFMIASLAKMAGIDVTIFSAVPLKNFSSDSLYMLQYAQSLDINIIALNDDYHYFTTEIIQADIVVDAIFGIGLNRDIGGKFAKIIDIINCHSSFTLSVDVPSGICATTGQIRGSAIYADITVSFIAPKFGLYTGDAPNYTGEIIFAPLVDISLEEFTPLAKLLSIRDLPHYTQQISQQKTINKSHKGHVAIIGGDIGMCGAAIMSATAALTIGAGKVSLFTHPEHAHCSYINTPEIMCYGIEALAPYYPLLEKVDVIAIGCGMSKTLPWSNQIFKQIQSLDKPFIIDAGGLDFLESDASILRNQVLITPHEGEAARLLNTTSNSVQNDRLAALKTLSEQYHAMVLLKGHGSLIMDNSNVFLSRHGHHILATAGSGDVLTGLITGLYAQLKSLPEALKFAVLLQGLASEEYAKNQGAHGFSATKLLPEIIKVLNNAIV